MMNISRRGKIARLPREVRDKLNRRLDNGEPGSRLVKWLNASPKVRAVLAAEFGGIPIREQNLSEWRQGGYREWLAQQESFETAGRMAADAAELQQPSTLPLTDHLAVWLTARYLVAARKLDPASGQTDWKPWRELCKDLIGLRRGDHSAERLRLERERLADDRLERNQDLEKLFWEWFAQPKIQEKIRRKEEEEEEKAVRDLEAIDEVRRAVFGELPEDRQNMKSPDPAPPDDDPPGSPPEPNPPPLFQVPDQPADENPA